MGDDRQAPTGTLPFETLLQSQEFVEADGQTLVILTSHHEETAFLSGYEQYERFPEVDYSKDVAVGLLTGRRSNNSYSVTVDSLVASREAVHVHATETGSASGGRVVTHPAHFIAVSRRDLVDREIALADIHRICERSPCAWE